jgi:hypothetical protein
VTDEMSGGEKDHGCNGRDRCRGLGQEGETAPGRRRRAP